MDDWTDYLNWQGSITEGDGTYHWLQAIFQFKNKGDLLNLGIVKENDHHFPTLCHPRTLCICGINPICRVEGFPYEYYKMNGGYSRISMRDLLGLWNWEFGNGKSETGKGKKEKGNRK